MGHLELRQNVNRKLKGIHSSMTKKNQSNQWRRNTIQTTSCVCREEL